MTDQTTELKLETRRLIPATPERLYDAWLDPGMLARFMMPAPDVSVPEVTADTRVGGRFCIVMRAGDRDMPHKGTYTVLDRPNRIAFTWESPFSTLEDSIVTIDFAKVEGGTEVRLSHVRFESEDARTNHEKGWGAILAALETAI